MGGIQFITKCRTNVTISPEICRVNFFNTVGTYLHRDQDKAQSVRYRKTRLTDRCTSDALPASCTYFPQQCNVFKVEETNIEANSNPEKNQNFIAEVKKHARGGTELP